jgi:hypothetical protein
MNKEVCHTHYDNPARWSSMLFYQPLDAVPDKEPHQGDDYQSKVKHPCNNIFHINSLIKL